MKNTKKKLIENSHPQEGKHRKIDHIFQTKTIFQDIEPNHYAKQKFTKSKLKSICESITESNEND